jgi:hypothetical protein
VRVSLVVAMVLLGLSSSCGGSKFVRPGGSNASGGTTWGAAWQTLAYAGTRLQAGDTLFVGGGVYSELLSVAASGTAARPIVVCPYQGEAVRLQGSGIDVTGKSYQVFEDLRVENVNCSAVWLQDCEYITIQRIRVYNVSAWAAIKMFGTRYCRILKNYVDRADTTDGTPGKDGDGIHVTAWHPTLGNYPTHHNLIRGNFVTRCFHSAIGLDPSIAQHHNIVDGNYLYINHNGIDVSGEYNLIQNNLLWKSAGVLGRGGDCIGFKALCNYTIARYNVVIDDSLNPAQDLNWRGVAVFGTWLNTGSAQHNRIYHNTFYFYSDERNVKGKYPLWNGVDNGGLADSISDFRFVNNIFYRNVNGDPIVYLKDPYRRASQFTTVFDNNVFHKDTGSCIVAWSTSDLGGTMSLAQAQQVAPACWKSTNKDMALPFADEGNRDLRPAAGSYAVDRGIHLTVATAGGTGSATLAVNDGVWFADGYGLTAQDSVKIEGSPAVGVAGVNGNTLTLSAARTWAAGARIWYYRADRFVGTAPDIGALEYDGMTVSKGDNASNVVANPAFEAGSYGWSFYSDAPARFSVVAEGFSGTSCAKMIMDRLGVNVQLFQSGIVLEANTQYRLRFRARSSRGHGLSVSLHQHGAPYTEYGPMGKEFVPGTEWGLYEVEFATRNFVGSVNDARLSFWFAGYPERGDVYLIDDVELKAMPGTNAVSEAQEFPSGFRMLQNFPNPFNPTTTIAFDIPEAGRVSLRVFNVLGAEVGALLDGQQAAGRNRVQWSPEGLPSGVYFARLQAGAFTSTVKMLYMR